MKSRLAFLPQHVLPALVCFALALASAQTDWLQRVENVTLDTRAKLRARYFPTHPRDDDPSRARQFLKVIENLIAHLPLQPVSEHHGGFQTLRVHHQQHRVIVGSTIRVTRK